MITPRLVSASFAVALALCIAVFAQESVAPKDLNSDPAKAAVPPGLAGIQNGPRLRSDLSVAAASGTEKPVTVQKKLQPQKAADVPVADKMHWFSDGKFGLFLHWGLYSQAAGEWHGRPAKGNEHLMLHERIPLQELKDSLAATFNPVKFDALSWVRMAKQAGMKYIVITAKHHEGFAMFDSPSNAFNIVEATPYKKDPMKELAEACRKEGLKLCFYYSLGRDWEDPDVPTNWPVPAGRSNTWDYPDEKGKVLQRYVDRKVLPQIRELLTNYGPIGILWFDTPELITKEQSETIKNLIDSLQPDCIINDRIGNGMGDYQVREQSIGGSSGKPFETCVTMSGGWGYNRYDTAWKSPELLVRQLTEVVSKGGNYLLNIGPTAEGTFPQPAVERLQKIGEWMQANGEAIYEVKPWITDGETVTARMKPEQKTAGSDKTYTDVLNDHTSKAIVPELRFTAKNNYVYVFVNSFYAPGVQIQSLAAKNGAKIKQVILLKDKKAVPFKQTADALEIPLSPPEENTINVRVFKIELENALSGEAEKG